VDHTIAEMILFCTLLIAAGFPDATDCGVLRRDLGFKLAGGCLAWWRRRSPCR
jgi:hypothetical protein